VLFSIKYDGKLTVPEWQIELIAWYSARRPSVVRSSSVKISFKQLLSQKPPRAVTFSWWVGLHVSVTRIAMLAGVFILLLGPPKPDRLKD